MVNTRKGSSSGVVTRFERPGPTGVWPAALLCLCPLLAGPVTAAAQSPQPAKPPAEAASAPRPAPVDVEAPPAELRVQLQRMYMDFLSEEGFRSEVDEDGDVHFKREGYHFYFIIDDEDAEYLRLLLPGVWEMENDAQGARMLEAADAVNRETKVVKACLVGKQADLSVEMFVSPPEDFRKTFARAMAGLERARTRFLQVMEQEP